MSQSSVVWTLRSPAVLELTLNRPASLNAINSSLLDALVASLRRAADDPDIRVIVLQGAGPRSFCAGEDLKQTLVTPESTPQELESAFNQLQDITRLTSSTNKLVIAAVHGFAIGGGAEIALAADFVIGGPDAKFKFPEVTLGHAVTGGISLRLTQMVGLLKAKELLIRGKFVAAEEALRLGLLTELADNPKERALELALELAQLPIKAAQSSKQSLERAVFPNMEEVLVDEVQVANFCFAQSDAEQAFHNFRQRKRPVTNGEQQHRHNATSNGIVDERKEVHAPTADATNVAFAETAEVAVNQGQVPKDLNTALQTALQRFPERVFVRFAQKDTTFQEFDQAVAKLAGGLREAGVKPGDRVVVMMRNSLEALHTWFATNRLGATWVPVNVELKSITLRHVVNAARARLAIVDREFIVEIRETNAFSNDQVYVKEGELAYHNRPTHENCSEHDTNSSQRLASLYSHHGVDLADAVPVLPSTPAAFLYTSGTTGKSKPCILSHQYFILQAMELIDSFGLRQDDVLYCPFPLFHADATALTTVPALLLGATAALSVRFSASRFWDEIRATRATVYDFMGATLALTYKQEPCSRDLDHHVRLAWGVPIPHFHEDYERRFGHPLYTLYGSVEANLPIMQQRDTILPTGSCGRLRPGYHLRIADDFDEELPPNTPGQLLLRSDKPNAFFQGYFGNDQDTIQAWQNLWFHTGDLAKVDEHGNVYFVGRIKDVIRRRGENINASEVEEEFLKHRSIATAAAVAIPSDLGSGTEEDVKMVVELRGAPEHQVTEEELWTWATTDSPMARFQVPSVIQIVPEIKKTPTGKVEKQALPIAGGKRFDIRRAAKSTDRMVRRD